MKKRKRDALFNEFFQNVERLMVSAALFTLNKCSDT